MGQASKLGCWICLVLIFLTTGACDDGKKYGEECISTSECNGKDLLGCQNGICSCFPSTSLLYEDDLRRCVARVGEKCGSLIRGDTSVTIACTEGALCDESSGGCVCTDDYFRIPNGTCSKKRRYMESCKTDSECGKDFRNFRPLICYDGLCDCDRKKQVYDTERKQCVTLVAGSCNSEIVILPNSSISRNECSSHATCVQGKCECDSQYVVNSRGQCGLAHGEPCGVKRKCSDLKLTCLDGVCECKYPLHQIYDERTKDCVGLVSGPCTLLDINTPQVLAAAQPNILRCTKNAVCVDQGFYTGCECLTGFVQKKDGQCSPGFGQKCEADECDPITPLYCRNNICSCRDELQIYDAGRKKCLGLVGSRCNLSQPFQQCVEFCSCIQVGVELEGKCLCDKYSEEVENRTCIYL